MHPHLSGETKQLRCGELIAALQACHRQGLWHRITGECNPIKTQLTLCLRQERIERTQAHVQESKQKRKKTQEIWKEIDADK